VAARDALRGPRPDLVVLDVMMPKRNGFEVCEAVRADPELAGVRILMLTAKGREADFDKGMKLGADAYLAKPFSTRELVQKVRELLES
jgi:DNA-binding response OmpR family regulator